MNDQVSAEAGNAEESTQEENGAWYGSLEDPDLQAWADNKGFKAPVEALNSYRNLEKLFGADKAGRTVVMPGENAEQQELDEFYNKLGRPEAADKYELELPADADTSFVEWFKESSFKNGLTSKQVQDTVASYGEFVNQYNETTTAAQTQKANEEEQQLRTKWGAAYEAEINKADFMLTEAGFSDEVRQSLFSGPGGAAVAEGFANLHNKFHGEGRNVVPEGEVSKSFGNPMTPQQAQSKLDELKADPDWVAKVLSNSAFHVEQKENLEKWIVSRAS